MKDDEHRAIIFWVVTFFVLLFMIWLYYNFVSPTIYIWQERMRGEAELAHAEANRQIATCEAMAKKESAYCLAEAEIIRAEGVAKANKIIGSSLEDNEGYLRYLYINQLGESRDRTVIYIPTEATLPILEAGRMKDGR